MFSTCLTSFCWWSTTVNHYLNRWLFALTSKETITTFRRCPQEMMRITSHFWRRLQVALSKDESKHEKQPVTHRMTTWTAKPKLLSSTDCWLFWRNQPGRTVEGEWLQATAHHFASTGVLIFWQNRKLWPTTITVFSSTAHTDIEGIVSRGIQITKCIPFHGEVNEKILLIETQEHLMAD